MTQVQFSMIQYNLLHTTAFYLACSLKQKDKKIKESTSKAIVVTQFDKTAQEITHMLSTNISCFNNLPFNSRPDLFKATLKTVKAQD